MNNLNLQRTPLYSLLSSYAGVKFVPFSGWEMPIQFKGIKDEHSSVRDSAGIFDISHMGKFLLTGSNLLAELQRLVPSDLARLESGKAQYTVLLNQQAGIIDDLIVYYRSSEEIFLIVNAATLEKDKQWLTDNLPSSKLEDVSKEKVLLALQGPQALRYLQPFLSESLEDLKPFEHRVIQIQEEEIFLAHTGYTGENGVEMMISPALGEYLWKELTEAGVTPCGLGARDTLRLEAAMSLYGQDIDESTSPLEAGLGWLVHLDYKEDFFGRSILQMQRDNGVSRRLVAIEMSDRNIARHGYKVFAQEKEIGEVTSGTYSPTLSKPIALAYVTKEFSSIGQTLFVEIRGKLQSAKVVKKPFYHQSK